jgi:hypothetical protein
MPAPSSDAPSSPGTCSAITVTESAPAIVATQIAPAITVTESASAVIITETSTTTVTNTPSSQPTCSAALAVKNPSSESVRSWILTPNAAISSGLIRGSSGSANPPRDGTYLIQSAIDRVLDVNSGHKVTQAIRICPGQQYRFSIWLKTISASAATRPTLAQVFIHGVRILTSTAVDQTWTEFTGVWNADRVMNAANVQIVTCCEAAITSGTWSYVWMDLATLSPVLDLSGTSGSYFSVP